MFTVALIGGDGAGKTTIANAVIQSSGLPMRYLYMGLSTRSSNVALPSSRLVLFLKKQIYKQEVQNSNVQLPEEMPANQLEYSEKTHGWVWNTLRFLNRIAEAWYRQMISINYQLHGFIVVFDRHFFFDTAPGAINSQNQKFLPLDRLFFWIMSHVYPRPTLTIFLDAPAKLLYERKLEASPEYLDRQRHVFLEQGKKLAHFVIIDASQPLEKVINEVMQQIKDFYTHQYHQSPGIIQREKFNNK
jgi:thymidylate kinase